MSGTRAIRPDAMPELVHGERWLLGPGGLHDWCSDPLTAPMNASCRERTERIGPRGATRLPQRLQHRYTAQRQIIREMQIPQKLASPCSLSQPLECSIRLWASDERCTASTA